MIGFIFRLTLRQLAVRRSTLLLAGLCSIPLIVAVVFRLSDPAVSPERFTARVLFVGLIAGVILPLTALILGTSAIGDEIEDGTVIYLLTKPIQRWQILLPKVTAAWLITSALVVPFSVLACSVSLEGRSETPMLLGVGAALIFGCLAYTAVFAFLSVATSRALITGLVYVFLWEGAITAIFNGTRYLSIRHYTVGLADWIAGSIPNTFEAYVGGTTALIMAAIATAAALILANRRLQALEVREPT